MKTRIMMVIALVSCAVVLTFEGFVRDQAVAVRRGKEQAVFGRTMCAVMPWLCKGGKAQQGVETVSVDRGVRVIKVHERTSPSLEGEFIRL